MRRLVAIGAIWCTLQITLAGSSWAAEETQLQTVQVSKTPTGSRIILQASHPLAVITYMLTDPDRLIVDPAESALMTTVSPVMFFDSSGPVHALQVVMDQQGVDYLEFSVVEPVQATLYHAGQLMTIEVESVKAPAPPRAPVPQREQPTSIPTPKPAVSKPPPAPRKPIAIPPLEKGQSPAGTVPVSKPPASPPPPKSAGQAPSIESGPLTPQVAVDKALAVYEPARIALQETEVALLKVKEARRNLFPGASVKGSYTQGKASAEFREQRLGLQVEHPLYDAGRLRDAYKQALVNLQISQKRYEKVRADFAFEVAQAYFEYLAARQGIGSRDRLLKTAQEIAYGTQRRFDAGLVTRMEWLNVQSQLSQARFQTEGARNDSAVAELKFRHRLQWDAPLPIALPDQFPTMTASVALEDALRTAAWQRPDVQINTLLVQFHQYEERLARKKAGWKLDVTGFAGESGGAFKTEPLEANSDYSIALKMSKAWGGSTASVTGTKTATSPQVGQTTRTSSNSVQGEIGILNALAGKTEIEQAHVGRMKAEQDLAETRQTLAQEVHEAYYAYQKAALTLQHAQEKERFRLEQVKVLRAQAELNEILPSQLLEAELQLSDDQVSQLQAQASYHTALARLNKAIGMTGYYSAPTGGGS